MLLKKAQLSIYILLFSITILIPSLYSICFICVILLNFLSIITKRNIEIAVLSTMVMGNETFSLLNALISILGLIIIKRRVVFRKKELSSTTLFVIFIILVNSVINGLLNDTLINVLFYAAYLGLLFICFVCFNGALELKKSVFSVRQLVVIEFIATVLRIIVSHSLKPGDYYTGTLNNAHFFGNWIVLTAIVLISSYKSTDGQLVSKKSIIFDLFLLVPMLYLADAKQIVLSLIIAFIIYVFVRTVSLKNQNVLFWTIIGLYVSVVFILWFFALSSVKNVIIDKMPVYSMYLYSDGLNGRYNFAYGTFFDSLANARFFFGYGLGQYGSRVANAFAYNMMWRSDSFINNFIASNFSPHYVPEFVRYVSYYDAAFVSRIQFYSAVLSYPFSSLIALIGETGVVGTVLIAYLINKYFKKTNSKFIIIYFLSICILDIYLDDFQCVIAAILYVTMNDRSKQKGF